MSAILKFPHGRLYYVWRSLATRILPDTSGKQFSAPSEVRGQRHSRFRTKGVR